MQSYFLYHLHSDLSSCTTTADSVTKYKDYVQKAKECGMTALAFTEHGNIFEWYFKKLDIEKAGMKYVHGVEAYVTEDGADSMVYSAKPIGKKKEMDFLSIWEQEGKKYGKSKSGEIIEVNSSGIVTKPRTTKDNYHVVLLAKNYEGFKEINKLTSESYNRKDNHYYYKPRIRFEDLIKTSKNIVITTACLGGILYQKSPLENSTIRERFIQFLMNNKDRCYLELQHHDCEEQKQYNQTLIKLHKISGIPLIVGTDTHALNEDQMKARHYLQVSKKNKDDDEAVNGGYYEDEDNLDLTFKTPEELIKAYEKQNAIDMKYVYEAMQNSLDLAESVEPFEISAEAKYPKLFKNSEHLFLQKIRESAKERGLIENENWAVYKDRINREFKIYKHNNAIDFMLLEWDYKNALAKQGVFPGPSRGSVSGSIIADLLNVTYVDSVKYNLNFERFMHNERVSLADVDSDWFDEDRSKVKDYLYHRNGLYCSEIATFNQIKRKAAIDNICKGMFINLPDKEYMNISDKLKSALCDDDNDGEITEKEFKIFKKKYPDLYSKYEECLKIVNIAINSIVSIGNHPAATIVSPHPLDECIGLFTTKNCNYPVSALYMKEVDALNYVKLDILGLDTVGLIKNTCDLAEIEQLTPRGIDFNDENVWKDMANDSTLIFQFESDMASAYIKELLSEKTVKKVKKYINDFSYLNFTAMANAALRPAGASYRDKLKKGIVKRYGCKPLDDFMAPSLGYMIYQETIMNFLNKFCGFTMGEADMVRRGFAKFWRC